MSQYDVDATSLLSALVQMAIKRGDGRYVPLVVVEDGEAKWGMFEVTKISSRVDAYLDEIDDWLTSSG